MEAECKEAQDDERLVIESVYDNKARFEKNAWQVWKPLSVTITLEPAQSESRQGPPTVTVDLSVVCSARYPREVPTISISNVKGISKELVEVLRGRLVSICHEHVGNAVILDLCEDVRQFLYEHSPTVKGSFHDNMVKNQEKQKKEMHRQRLTSEARDLEQVDEIVKEREQHNLEGRREEELKPKAFLEDAPIRVIDGRTIAVKSSNFAKRQRPHAMCNEWVGVYQNEEVLVSEWIFKFTLGAHAKRKEPVFHEFLRKLDEVEQILKRFPALTGLDQTVVPYLFCHVDRRSTTPQNMHILVTIGQRVRESEQSLSTIINSIKHEPNICRRLAVHAICALRWLHDMGFAHGAIATNCFWVSDSSFRLSDTGTLAALTSLADTFQRCIAGEAIPSPVGDKNPRRRDLFALGAMIDGIRLDLASSSSCTFPGEDLTKFIHACQSAKKVEELLNLSFLKVDLGAAGSGDSRFGIWNTSENCRLTTEFITMKLLGSGGFGEVLLARNKIDDNNYAIKRIPMFAKSEKLNSRIAREAQLFSKLTHPNIVRYFSAWFENTERKENDASKKNSPRVKDKSKVQTEDSLLPTKLRNLENAQFNGGDTSEWSSMAVEEEGEDDEDEESTREQVLFDRGVSDDDDMICFEGGSVQEFEQETDTEGSSRTEVSEVVQTPITVATTDIASPDRILYIQMEFCGHGTLRSFIDTESLVGNHKTIWRIFREILSGLSYIHTLNMIHRDIKPMNILLDEEDRVKIGDFGLATRDFIRKLDAQNGALQIDSKQSGQTKDIGTELYMAPELFDVNDRSPYSAKIDVYSTGVVLFEMFYKPLLIGMERLSTLRALKKSISFPVDFGQGYPPMQLNLAKKIISMMLQEKAENRPTVDELLQDEQIAVDVDDQAVKALLQKSVKRGSQTHRSMLQSLFECDISASQNYCFDVSLCTEKIPDRNSYLAQVQEQMRMILERHCFEPTFTHHLLPAPSVLDVVESRQKPVLLLDSNGFPVALPLDLRQNFVRSCCRSDVYRKKRYCIDRVYRSTDGIGFEHPTERWECSVDSIGPLPDVSHQTAELMATVAEICSTTVAQANFTISIGHIGFVIAACRHLNIADDQRKLVLQKLHELSTSNKVFSKAEKTNALSLVIGSRSSASLLSFLQTEQSLGQFKETLKGLLKSRDETVRDLSRRALAEIEHVIDSLEDLEVPSRLMNIKFDASLVYRPATFRDGLIFMVVREAQSKKGVTRAIVLGGGRYDSSLTRERHPRDNQPKVPLCLVGCSIALDVIISLKRFYKEKCTPACSAIVCSLRDKLTSHKFTLARRLWNANIATDIMHEPIGDINEALALWDLSGVDHVLVVYGKDEVLVVIEGVAQGKMDFDDAVAFLCSPDSDDEPDLASIMATPNSAARSTSGHCVASASASANYSNCDIKIANQERLTYGQKKRIMNSITKSPPDAVSLFSSKSRIEIIVTELSEELVKSIAGSVSRTTTIQELSTIFDGLSRKFGKAKEDVECMFATLKPMFSPRPETVPIIILYRHADGFHKVIT